jgi:hypothetical protein
MWFLGSGFRPAFQFNSIQFPLTSKIAFECCLHFAISSIIPTQSAVDDTTKPDTQNALTHLYTHSLSLSLTHTHPLPLSLPLPDAGRGIL